MDNELHKQLEALIKRGDEEKVRSFVVEHLKEFPKKDQDELIVGLVEDALSADADGETAVSNFRKHGFLVAKEIEKAQEELGIKEKLLDIKESL